jgi:hypothetical protein
LRAVRACSGLGPLLRAKGGKVAVGEKNNKIEGSRADTRVVGGIVYWRGVHTNTHADKEQAGRQARVDRVLRVSRLTVRCVIRYCVAGYAMVTLQGKVNEVITEHRKRGLRNVSGNGLLGMLPARRSLSHHMQIGGASERLLVVSKRTS